MGKIVGIDLGTTNSCIAYCEGDEVIIIPGRDGNRVTPSIVGYSDEGERLVGIQAKRQMQVNPKNTVYAVKRLIGKKFDDKDVQHFKKLAPFEIIPSDNGDAWVQIRGRHYSPAQISAYILEVLKEFATKHLGFEVKKAIITVPAYFNDSQRQATRDAGRIAGLDVVRIINEPTAASVAYGLTEKDVSKIAAVYDLGGGTFDISIVEINHGVIEVKSTNGNTYLGGEDFDNRIIDYVANLFAEEHGIDLRKDAVANLRLKEACERAKCELSTEEVTKINLPFITTKDGEPLHLNVELTRERLEALTKDLAEKTLEYCEAALKDAGLKVTDIDEVILVGGQTRMPLIRRVVKDFFKRDPSDEVNPDEVVAAGAAIQASIMAGDKKDILLLDVTPLSLGVETKGGIFTKLIERNTTIPTQVSEIFTTAVDNQTFVDIHILQGEREMAKDNISIGRLKLTNIPPAPKGVPQIEVTFKINSDGILKVTAKDLGTGKEQSISITPSSGLSEAEIKRMIREAEEYKLQDKKRRELVELKNKAEGLIFSVENSIKEYADKLEEGLINSVKEVIDKVKEIMNKKELEPLKEYVEKLESLALNIGEAIYSGVSPKVVLEEKEAIEGSGQKTESAKNETEVKEKEKKEEEEQKEDLDEIDNLFDDLEKEIQN